ncbi:MAG: DUF2608 domain-containing protein [Verrucomicrobia bacterium]|nr:DUF2608 domain-containing protein [Verrucomicrobiota bacterium]
MQAQITQITTLEEAMQRFQQTDCHTLAIFDLDMVLIQPSDPAFQMPMICRYSAISKRVMQSLSADKKHIFLTLMTLGSNPMLIDPDAPSYLADLQNAKIPTIALTGNLTGQLQSIDLVPWKISHLCQLGLDFSHLNVLQGEYVFSNLAACRGNYPLYQNGVLFTNSLEKGEVLVNFLKYTNLHIERVVFIDDREHNLKDVAAALLAYNPDILYEGLHYLGACAYPCPTEISEQEFEKKWEDLAELAKKTD